MAFHFSLRLLTPLRLLEISGLPASVQRRTSRSMQAEIDEPTLAGIGFDPLPYPPSGYAPPCDGATPTRSSSGRGRKMSLPRAPPNTGVCYAPLSSDCRGVTLAAACSQASDRQLRAVTEMGKNRPRALELPVIDGREIVVPKTRHRRASVWIRAGDGSQSLSQQCAKSERVSVG